MRELITVWRRSTTAELCWIAPDGPTGIPVVPLVWDDRPCVALPLAHLDAVDTMTSGHAAFAVTGERPGGAPAVVGTGRVDIRFDLEGERFIDHLLDQEAVKHPPTRLRSDSMMARRENWWWLARVLITLIAPDEIRELPGRSRPEDALLVRPDERGARGNRPDLPRVDIVTSREWHEEAGGTVDLWERRGSPLEGTGEPAFAFSHAYSPDRERWERWYRTGTLVGEELRVQAGVGLPQSEPRPFSILERFRNHRDVARACRKGIATAESRLVDSS
ncbi:hypothetical protein CDO52_13575 [Nocardiopsis gilva YIM 90087]|uniref:Uncharacterized protein n=1 Tax=Nocardiopsis gilva YIM 90087 TaxID=1235441 RepID=A0A223S6F1_9ACTN|nr:hypothetical protein [Nocardiopsis gilva]ASU83682.1 hypothetical protein CDO52_13575 [Nocardiopsis gilva YIM 90087]